MHPISKKAILTFYFFSTIIFAQKQFVVSGYVKDKTTGEELIGGTISIKAKTQATSTNGYGHYSISAKPDTISILCSYLGYQTQSRSFELQKDTVINFELISASKQIDEIEVTSTAYKEQVNSTQTSMLQLTTKEAKSVPVILGEVDLIKVLQLKPGVQSGGEGFAGLYVRGGGADQNMFLLDEATVYNPGHLFGFFSTFNPDAVKSVDLYKGGFPAQYGGRLSSIVDVRMNEGNKTKFSGSGGIGLIASRGMIEMPIVKNKGSILIAGRRTYADIFTEMYNQLNKNVKNYEPIPAYYFYDLNLKANYILGNRDRIFLSGYFGQDVFGFQRRNFKIDFTWGNINSTFRWNHVFSGRLFSNLSILFSDYRYEIKNALDAFKFSLGSSIRDYSIKYDFDYNLNTRHAVKFGAQFTRHDFVLNRISISTSDNSSNFLNETPINAYSFAAYVGDDFDLSLRWKLYAGLRFSGIYNPKTYAYYINPEPRAAVRYKINERFSLKGSYARMYQYLNLVSNSGASLPWDFWYPSNQMVKPQYSDQIAGGVSMTMFEGKVLITNELFYKWLNNQIDLKDGANIFNVDQIDSQFVFGKGWAYGNEFYIEKKEGKLHGWIGYTLSWNWRQFELINNGQAFPSRVDRRHDVSIVAVYDFSKRLSFSATWVYGTGNTLTIPVALFVKQGINGSDPAIVPVYDQRNNSRMAAYHRLDLGLIWKFYPKWGTSDLTFSIYNAYNNRNPYFVYVDTGDLQEGQNTAINGSTEIKNLFKQVSLFPIIPAVTYNFKF
ncbi:MAG: TonB-dependent receptor [Bacteroidota bacterium]|nr:TonB-dependent receptor [Bacteroidota bacterium]